VFLLATGILFLINRGFIAPKITKHGIFMKKTALMHGACLLLFVAMATFNTTNLLAQPVEEATEIETTEIAEPVDDFVTRQVVTEKKTLQYAPIREADILWEKRIWRVIDTREKMNLPFVAPESPLFTLLRDAVLTGEMSAYSTEDDKFTKRLDKNDIKNVLFEIDTITTINMDTGEEEVQIVQSELNWEDVKRFRIKEAWFFDKNLGTLRHRILGIAPMIDVKNDNGDFMFERPLFWVNYPTSRNVLAQHKAIATDNVAATITWEDLFETRHFASYISKESNVYDRRLQDYLAGTDLLMESQKIEDELFNKEHDLWSW
jgi:gliding motility associated protien GldN